MNQITKPATTLPANKLASIVARAKKTLPATTGAAAAAAERIRQMPGMTILADTSGSMSSPAGTTRRIDVLRASLATVLVDVLDAAIIGFSSTPRPLPPGSSQLPEPGGGTDMHLALEAAPTSRILVISDGEPSSESLTLKVATRLVGAGTTIDTLFIGNDSDLQGIDFMRRLAMTGRGRAIDIDITKAKGDTHRLSAAIRLLAAPK